MLLDKDGVFVIAEIGGNHEGDIDYALRLTDLAIESGADAVKYQIYSPNGLVNKNLDPDRFQHFKKFTLAFDEYERLAKRCISSGVQFMSSIWQSDAIDHFDSYINIHKVGSGDLTNYLLLKRLALTNKPIILSTAMANLDEVSEAIHFIESANGGYKKKGMLAILQCVAMYGNPKDNYANVSVIDSFYKCFPDKIIGYSDHTVGSLACEVAVAKGARILEVHFTDDKTRAFRDHHIAMDNSDIVALKKQIELIHSIGGSNEKVPIFDIETPERIKEFRRACYLKNDQTSGTVITADMLTCLRPCIGVPANEVFSIIGKKLKCDVEALSPLNHDMFS